MGVTRFPDGTTHPTHPDARRAAHRTVTSGRNSGAIFGDHVHLDSEGEIESPLHVTSCTVEAGTVCPHGYRFDLVDRRIDGDGCRVVALDTQDRGGWKKLPAPLRAELQALPVGSEVTVLLDDGRVVRTIVRGPPRDLGSAKHPAWLVWLDGFSGGFSLERVRPADWRWWATPLATVSS